MTSGDTIFALSSGKGIAGVAVLRVSGPAAGPCIDRLAGTRPPPRHAALRWLRDEKGERIDRGLVLWFPGPGSFTGEDAAEFHVHGSAAVIAKLCEELGRHARPAEAGEFTRRAFRNGRLDLVEAEGLADLLEARTDRQRRQALNQIDGGASARFEDWRRRLVGVLARVEASVDFIEEADVARSALAGVAAECRRLIEEMRVALAEGDGGRAVRAGITVVLAGLPNTGKSSLLNLLARRDAAIVSSIPGTTRDVVEVEIVLDGVPVLVSDTAGLREGAVDEIEREGMIRTRRVFEQSDVKLWVSAPDVAGSAPMEIDSDTLWVENKADLPQSHSNRCRNDPHYRISAKTGAGVAELIRELSARVETTCGTLEAPAIVRARQAEAVSESLEWIEHALEIGPADIEIFGEELRLAARAIGRITGVVDVEELLDSIFRSFCVGK